MRLSKEFVTWFWVNAKYRKLHSYSVDLINNMIEYKIGIYMTEDCTGDPVKVIEARKYVWKTEQDMLTKTPWKEQRLIELLEQEELTEDEKIELEAQQANYQSSYDRRLSNQYILTDMQAQSYDGFIENIIKDVAKDYI